MDILTLPPPRRNSLNSSLSPKESFKQIFNYSYTVSVLGQDEEYTVKYNLLPEGVFEGPPFSSNI